MSDSFEPAEFLGVARHLRSYNTGEGFQRSTISRAYYAAFLTALSYCCNRGWMRSTGGASDHGAVASSLTRMSYDLSDDFRNLQKLRRDADYKLSQLNSRKLALWAQQAVDLSDGILQQLT